MNTLKQLSWLLLLLAVTAPATARDKDHFAVKTGFLEHEDPAYEPALNVGLTVGGKLLRGDSAALGLQFELSTSVIEGKTTTALADWEMDSHALYTVLHLGRRHYFKLKAGYIDWQVRYDRGDESEFREGRGPSWGIGYGYPLDSGNYWELEYSIMSDEEDFGINYLSLGYYF
ncbi:MAG: outer membrane beta-barrel protein [Thiohalophilus sp.]